MTVRTILSVPCKEWLTLANTRRPKPFVIIKHRVVARRVKHSLVSFTRSMRSRRSSSRRSSRSHSALRKLPLRPSTRFKQWSTSSLQSAQWFSSRSYPSITKISLSRSVNKCWRCKSRCLKIMRRLWKSSRMNFNFREKKSRKDARGEERMSTIPDLPRKTAGIAEKLDIWFTGAQSLITDLEDM